MMIELILYMMMWHLPLVAVILLLRHWPERQARRETGVFWVLSGCMIRALFGRMGDH